MALIKRLLLTLFFILILGPKAFSQAEPSANNTKFVSEIDAAIGLNKISVAPGADNSGGIYVLAAEEKLKTLIDQDHIWSYVDKGSTADQTNYQELTEQPGVVIELLAQQNADGFFLVNTQKGNKGIAIEMSLYSRLEGLPITLERYTDEVTFEKSAFQEIIEKLYLKIKNNLPYSGIVQSRQGNSLTVNIGSKDGIRVGDQLTFVQILKVNRHPKLNFIVGFEKEILGQGTVKKTDETLSFVDVTFEKEKGVIQKQTKIQKISNLNYTNSFTNGSPRDSSNPSGFAKPHEQEWLPPSIPQFGKLHAGLAFADHKTSSVLQDGSAIESGNSFCPIFRLGAELWMTKSLVSQFNYQQSFFKGNNNLVGSSPGTMNFNVNVTQFALGYRHHIQPNFWGPFIQGSIGYYSFNQQVTDTEPTAFSTMKVTAPQIGIDGYFPVTQNNDIAIGVDAKFLVSPSLSESPVSSGSANPSVSDFTFYGVYQWSTNIQFRGSMQIQNIQGNFTGIATRTNPARSVEIKSTSYGLNLEYLF